MKIFFAWNLTLSDLCTCDDSLGIEDSRLATHLLNYTIFQFLVWGHVQVSLLFGQPGDGFLHALSFTPV